MECGSEGPSEDEMEDHKMPWMVENMTAKVNRAPKLDFKIQPYQPAHSIFSNLN